MLLWVFRFSASMKSKSIRLLPVFIAVVAVGLTCFARWLPDHWVDPLRPRQSKFDTFQKLEWMTYDVRVRLSTRFSKGNATNLAFVYMDEGSIRNLSEGWGGMKGLGLFWPRSVYGRLLNELAAEGAEAVGFDIIFNPLRPDHPKDIDPATRDAIPSDEFFAMQLRKAGNAILAADDEVLPSELFRTNAWATADISAEKDSDAILRRVYAFREYPEWHPAIQEVAAVHGWRVDYDLRVIQFRERRYLKLMREVPIAEDGTFLVEKLLGEKPEPGEPDRDNAYIKRRVWHMGILLAAKHLKIDVDKSEIDLKGGRIVFHGENGLERVLPVDHYGRFYVNWTLSKDHPELTRCNLDPFLDAYHFRQKGELGSPTNLIKGKLVVIGSAAVGSNIADLGATPLSTQTMLTSTHWNVANSFITDRFIRLMGPVSEYLLITAMGLLAAILTWRLTPSQASLSVVAVAAAYTLACGWLYIAYRWWVPMVLPLLGGLILTHVGLVTYRVIFEESERRRVKAVFTRLVSPNVVNELLGQESLRLGGSRRRITVFFADVRGFTQMTDDNQAKAEEYVRQRGLQGVEAEAYFDESARLTLETVNLYLATIADTIKKHDGTLDKYIGDCVMAFWGAPTANEHHAVSCVRAAVEAQRAMHVLNQERAKENERRTKLNEARLAAGEPPLPMLALLALGTGINTGEAIVGLMGSEAHITNYTVFGREINLASRLEGVSGRGRIIIGEATHRDLLMSDPGLAASCAELDPVTPKGFSRPIRIFEVPWLPRESSDLSASNAAPPPQV